MKNKSWIIATSILTFTLLTIVQTVVKPPLLLGERLLPGGGWLQIGLATILSGWFYHKMSPRATRSIWRKRIWLSICRCLFQSANFRHHHRFRFPDVRNSAFPDSRLNSIRSHLSLAIIFHASAVSNHNIAFRWSVVQPALLFRGFRLLSCRKWPTTFHTSKTTASASPIHFNPIYGSSDYSALFCFFIITRNHFSRHNRSDRTIYYCDILPKSQNNGNTVPPIALPGHWLPI